MSRRVLIFEVRRPERPAELGSGQPVAAIIKIVNERVWLAIENGYIRAKLILYRVAGICKYRLITLLYRSIYILDHIIRDYVL